MNIYKLPNKSDSSVFQVSNTVNAKNIWDSSTSQIKTNIS